MRRFLKLAPEKRDFDIGLLSMSNLSAGFLLGASIHDVAQALGAGYSYSDAAGQIAAIVKLTRVALLAPVLAIVAFFLGGDGTKAKSIGLSWFVVGFFVLAGVNSLGLIPAKAAIVSAKQQPCGSRHRHCHQISVAEIT